MLLASNGIRLKSYALAKRSTEGADRGLGFMETLEFIIYPDGRVKEMVTGIVGSSCAEVTKAIEEQLGNVISKQETSEFYAQPQLQQLTESNRASSFSDW